jgi:hypothetical protein
VRHPTTRAAESSRNPRRSGRQRWLKRRLGTTDVNDWVTDPAVTLQRVQEFVADLALIGRSFHNVDEGF